MSYRIKEIKIPEKVCGSCTRKEVSLSCCFDSYLGFKCKKLDVRIPSLTGKMKCNGEYWRGNTEMLKVVVE